MHYNSYDIYGFKTNVAKVNRFGYVEKLADYPKVFERIV